MKLLKNIMFLLLYNDDDYEKINHKISSYYRHHFSYKLQNYFI